MAAGLGGHDDRANGRSGGDGIVRRDFIGGLAIGTALAAIAEQAGAATPATTGSPDPATYPPVRSGLRGQYPGSFEIAHAVRDGRFDGPVTAQPTGEQYDLIIVGGGISGLSAAHFYRKALGADRKILILDNHDDFGGHAKRNEFRAGGRTILGYGGTMSIESPFPYSYTAKALLTELGIQSDAFKRYEKRDIYKGLGRAIFFDRQNFGTDKLVAGYGTRPWEAFFAEAPISAAVRADLVRIHAAKTDYLPGLDPVAKAEALKRMTYKDFLLNCAKLQPEALPFFAGMGFRNNMRVDTCPAFQAYRNRAPGFQGMEIAAQIEFESDVFHFPDGNASIARLLVDRLVPGVFPSGDLTAETIVTAPARYEALDLPTNPTRLRLSSIVVRVEHIGTPASTTERAVRVVYSKGGTLHEATAANVILACFNNIIPFMVPSLPEEQKTALRYASKVPMQYTNVLVRNWDAWHKLGIRQIQAPNGYHPSVSLDIPVEIGGYASAVTPDQAIVVHMVRNPNKPGLSRKDQNRAGRMDMLQTPFETIEKEIRSQLDRMLGPGGFRSDRDILAITVNRWPHGYAYTYDSIGDPDVPPEQRPHVIGRRTFGRIAIANADAGAAAFTNVAIDQAERAVTECLVSRGLT